jgi:EAL domain-containing protein (putative c-di-GMP-specific phosphodiesterase class I)
MPDALFEAAVQNWYAVGIEQLCRTKAWKPPENTIFQPSCVLNVNPAVIHDEKFKNGFTKEYLKLYGIDPCNIFSRYPRRTRSRT